MASLLLKNLPKDSLVSLIPGLSDALNDISTILKLTPGDYIVKRGEVLQHIFIPLNDDLVLEFQDGKKGILQKGRSVSLGRALDGQPMTFDVRSMVINNVLAIKLDAFFRFMSDKPEYLDYLKIINTSASGRNLKRFLTERDVAKEIYVALLSSFEPFTASEGKSINFQNSIILIDEGKVKCKTIDESNQFVVDSIASSGSWIGGNAIMPPYRNIYETTVLSNVKGWKLSLEDVRTNLRSYQPVVEALYVEPWLDMQRQSSQENFDRFRVLTEIPAQPFSMEEAQEKFGIKLDTQSYLNADNDFDAIPIAISIYAYIVGRDFATDTAKDMLERFRGRLSPLKLGAMFEKLNVITKSSKCSVQDAAYAYEHFAFFYGSRLLVCVRKDKGGYLCIDGVEGLVYFKSQELEALEEHEFLGIMNFIPDKESDKTDLKDIQKVVKGLILIEKSLLMKMLLSSLIVFLFTAIVPSFSGIILDEIIYTNDEQGLIMALTGMGLSLLAVVIFTRFKSEFSLDLSMKVDDKLSRYLYFQILKLSPADVGRLTVGGVLNRISEMAKIREFFSNESVTTLINIMSLVVYAAILLTYSFEIILVPFSIVIGLVLLQVYIKRKIKVLNLKIFEAQNRMQTFIAETVFSVKTVKAFAAEPVMAKIWDQHLLDNLSLFGKTMKLSNGLESLVAFSSQLVQIVGIWIASYLFLNGKMDLSPGDLFGISMYLQRFVEPLNSLVQYYFSYEEVKIAFNKLSDIVPDNASFYDDRHSLTLKGKIRFDRVSFRYNSDAPWVLRDLSFSIFPGQIVGIVGKSGSGKTSLASLIAGNLHPTTGRIFYDDFERSFVSDESFLSQIGFIEQNNHLYAGSIKSNIAYNDDDPSLELVDKAVDLSYSREFIGRFPQGVDTYLAESGLGLSGGQKQRLCIARTIYSDPKIMLFDEATSALDAESEKAISDNLKQILKGRTAFIIAHRLATIRNADFILVLDQGKLAQMGNHEQLIKSEGIYRELFIEQSSV